MKRFLSYFSFLALFLVPLISSASVRINEISWMGNADSSSNEWIELYNDGTSSVSLSGWSLSAADGSPNISLKGSIPALGYFLLERTDDDSVSNVAADLIYSGALSNTGEKLSLMNASGTVTETVDSSSGWPKGDKAHFYSMQWNGGDWITAVPTPKAKNATVDLSSGSNDADDNDATSSSTIDDDTKTPSSHESSAPLSDFVPEEAILLDAGRDRIGVAGAELTFEATVENQDHENITPDLTWSMGDGTTEHGKEISHVYRFPGDYNVVLNAREGSAKAVARLSVSISEADVMISGFRSGEDGYVEVENRGEQEINLGGYKLKGNIQSFEIPQDTILSPNTKIKFANALTELEPSLSNKVSLYFPGHEPVKSDAVSAGTTSEQQIKENLVKAQTKLLSLTSQLSEQDHMVATDPAPEQEKDNVSGTSSETETVKATSSEANKNLASVADSIVVVDKPEGFWGKILHFFFTLGL